MRHVGLLTALFCACFLLFGCGTNTQGKQLQRSHTTEHHSTPQLLKVKLPWRKGMTQKGVAFYWGVWPNTTNEELAAEATASFNYAVGLGANSVSLSIPFFTGGINSNRLYRNSTTPSPQQLKVVLTAASARKLRVTVRPLLDEANIKKGHPGAWRGSIKPTSQSAWFASYKQFLKPYLKIAQAGKAATFSIGVEFNSLANDSAQWKQLVRWARHYYSGQIVYSVNWDDTSVAVSKYVDSTGVDAYFDTNLSDSASVGQLETAWRQYLNHAGVVLKKTVLTEVGIAAQDGAYKDPSSWGGKTYNPTVQSRWFTAACHAVKTDHLAGIYYWRADLGELNPPKSDRDNFEGRAAENAIKRCFS